MPEIARIDGIIVRVYSEKGGKHHTPHVHCYYSGDTAAYSLDGELLSGSLPSQKHKSIVEWIENNKETLESEWDKIN